MPGASSLVRIVSGGQTGVDQAALDAALQCELPCGGWVPRGRRTENGPLSPRYPLREARSSGYAERTWLNVRDAAATLVLTGGEPTGGTALTITFARRLGKPLLVLDLNTDPDPADVSDWLRRHRIGVLNIAGPRESTCPGIQSRAEAFLRAVFSQEAG